MCITTAKADLKNTLIYAGTARKHNKDVHVLAYQNIANNESNGPNAMVLPFPAAEPMSEENVIDTRSFKNFLKDITTASKLQTMMLGSRGFGIAAAMSKSAKVFDLGSYTIVLAEKANQIPEALTRVPTNKRPTISTRFLIGYGKMYPNQPIAVCCWDGHLKAEPLLWWYVPRDNNTLFIPTMDAHDGNAPDVNSKVYTDHIISVGSTMNDKVGKHFKVNYSDPFTNEAAGLLPRYVYGTKIDRLIKNGDMFIDTNELGFEKDWGKIPRIVRGTSFTAPDSKWDMFGWS